VIPEPVRFVLDGQAGAGYLWAYMKLWDIP